MVSKTYKENNFYFIYYFFIKKTKYQSIKKSLLTLCLFVDYETFDISATLVSYDGN